jgi:hypothetical protein
MKYYFIDGNVFTSDIAIAGRQELDADEVAFYLDNRNATKEEILAKELNVVPEPEPMSHIPDLEERLSILEELMLEIA